MVPALFLLLLPVLPAQTVPPGWKLVKDAKNLCQVAVPPEWTPLPETAGAAVLHDPTTAIAVVTAQPGQAFRPLTPSLQKMMGISKEKMFENTPKRIFYQNKTSRNPDQPNAYSGSVPAKDGACSCHIVWLPSVTEEVARKITLSLAPAQQ
jgi:hypothetical protein